MQEKDFKERRQYVRFDVDSKINFQVQEKNQAQAPLEKLPAVAKNLSVEGICFTSDRGLKPATILKLEVYLPSQTQPLHLQDQVKWSQRLKQQGDKEIFRIGVKLFTIEKNDESRFVGYVCDKMTQRLSQYLHL